MKAIHILAAILVAALWGGNFVAAKVGLHEVPPFLLTGIRFLITAALLLPFVPRPTREQIPLLLQLAVTLGIMHFGVMYGAIAYGLDVASCSVVAQTGVAFSCFFGWLWLKESFGMLRVVGVAVGLVGIFIIAGSPQVLNSPIAFCMAIAAAAAFGVANVQIKKLKMPTLQLFAWMMLFASPMLLVLSHFIEADPWARIGEASVMAWIALTYTILASTLIGWGLWLWLIKHHAVSSVAPYGLLTPLFSVVVDQLLYPAPIAAYTWIGGAITLVGMGLIVMRKPWLMLIGKSA